MTDIILASESPRRRELLDLIGVRYGVLAAGVDESVLGDESPEQHVVRLALAKAVAGRERGGDGLPVLGADTVVLLDEAILGKPRTAAEAADMLRRLAGRAHHVLSAVAVIACDGTVGQRLNRTSVEFGDIPARWIDQYCRSGEPMDKAGAYAIQGRMAQWVRRIDGSYSGVMGLPLFETAELLRECGVNLPPGRAGR